ncbi:hypothetical protein SELMODRAFT_416740 [Selaginella moellendorffii]|uniref:Uncharacterized protein n=1 Tax=Selaginella moellendorffii TaxID=88036 RepID=D8S093_SELML|nr:hypothetical protein SELMODRAFT_416740 [Selaginella moellendorffii]
MQTLPKPYKFRCSSCGEDDIAERTAIQGDPRNLLLQCHWDGFNISKTNNKIRCMVETGSSIYAFNKGSFLRAFDNPTDLRDAGVIGRSPLWRLHSLYGFKPHKDMIKDELHLFALDVKAANEYVSNTIATNVRNNGRWPVLSSSNQRNRCSSFKSEEYVKAVRWQLAMVLNKIGNNCSRQFLEVCELAIQITDVVFSISRAGWDMRLVKAMKQLCLAWGVRSEELFGKRGSIKEHSGEFLDGILEHGGGLLSPCCAIGSISCEAQAVESQFLFSVKDLKERGARARLPPGRLRNEMSAAGMFGNARSDAVLRRVRSIADSIAALPSVDFKEVKVFDKLPWPSLQPRVPRVPSEADGFWLVGRPVFKEILDRFAASKNDVIDLDGNVGSGKTYLLLMLSLHCLHEFSKGNQGAARKSRLVCIFRMPEERSGLLTATREALLVAFADDAPTCNCLCCIEDWEEMMEVVSWLKDTNDLFFVVDEYDVLDSRASSSSFMNVWLALEALEESSTCLHGGSARRNEAYARVFKTTHNRNYHCKYTAFTPEETKQYITWKGLPSEPGEMQALTGGLPLMVRVFMDCYVEAAASADREHEAREKFLSTEEVEQQRRTVEQWVTEIAALKRVRRRIEVAALSDLIAGTGRIDSDSFDP